jgi:hypothetical protein
MFEKIWKWGFVVPAAVAALAGGLADVMTGTLNYWPLLAPSYAVIGVSVWRGTSAKAEAARRAKQLAELDEAEAGKSAAPAEDLEGAPALVTDAPRVSVGSLATNLWQGFVRLLVALVAAFIYLIAIQAAIDIATWGRGYWYVYGPVLALIAWFVWSAWRSRTADGKPAKGGEPIVR